MHVAAGKALVALRRRHAALRADVLLGEAVELGHRDARLETLLHQRERAGDDLAGARHQLDLVRALANDHARASHLLERLLDLDPHLVDGALGVQRHELARRAVVLDDRLGLRVVDLESPGDRLGRVVGAALLARARPSIRSVATSSGRSKKRIASSSRPISLSISSSASPCASLRGKPSRTKPLACVGRGRAARGSARSSARRERARPRRGSARPAARASVCAAIAARNMSPVEMCGIPYSAATRFACVPLPAPGGPRTSRFTSGSPRRSASSSATASAASCRARRRRRSAPTCRRARRRSPARSRRSG